MTTRTNSNAAAEFPLDSFRDAATYLRRPFTPAAIKFKVQATWPKDSPTGGLIVSYIDARLVVERLNLIVPHLWSDQYEQIAPNRMWCHLTVDGITRSDVGEGDGKGLVSDALKRAGVKFGIGVSLYAVPKMMLNASDGYLEAKRSNKGPTLTLTTRGERWVRERYAAWLKSTGEGAFGDPLDHGDVPESQGDAEAGEVPAEAMSGEIPTSDGASPNGSSNGGAKSELPQELLDELVAAKQAAQLPDTAEAREWVRNQLRGIGVPDVPARVTLKTLKALNQQQASSLIDVFNDVAEKRAAEKAEATS